MSILQRYFLRNKSKSKINTAKVADVSESTKNSQKSRKRTVENVQLSLVAKKQNKNISGNSVAKDTKEKAKKPVKRKIDFDVSHVDKEIKCTQKLNSSMIDGGEGRRNGRSRLARNTNENRNSNENKVKTSTTVQWTKEFMEKVRHSNEKMIK